MNTLAHPAISRHAAAGTDFTQSLAVALARGLRASYLVVAETFAPLAERLLIRIAYGPAANRRDAVRDYAVIVLANLLSFNASEIIHNL